MSTTCDFGETHEDLLHRAKTFVAEELLCACRDEQNLNFPLAEKRKLSAWRVYLFYKAHAYNPCYYNELRKLLELSI